MILFFILYGAVFAMAYFWSQFFALGAVPIAVAWMIMFYSYRLNHIESVFNIKKLTAQKKIYQKMADDVLPQFKTLLTETFPEIEKKIFDKINVSNVDVFVGQFPEIKSDQTIMHMVSEINKKMSEVYDCDLKIERYKARMEIRREDARTWLPSPVHSQIFKLS